MEHDRSEAAGSGSRAGAEPLDPRGGVPPEAEAWRRLCGVLEGLGERLLSEEFPTEAADRTEGYSHLARLASCWLAWSVGFSDTERPAFQRQNDLLGIWGGPNVDNAYHHARIDPERRYRIRGRMHSCEDFILAVRAGFMHREKWGTLVEVTASELGIGPGDDFELLVGNGPGTGAGPAIPLPEGAVMVSIREYYFDWRADEPATFTIECLDPPAPPARLDGATLARRLEEAAAETEDSLVFWNRYMEQARADRQVNSFAASEQVQKGLASARYAFCFFDLEPGQALYVETDVPAARYWSLQLYTMGWFEPPDVSTRVAALNHVQAAVGGDGVVRAAVCAEDPGIENWLDTGGRRQGLLTLRWFWPLGDAPTPRAEVVAVDQVAGRMPQGTARPTAAEREAVMAERRAHLSWRFRT